MTYEVEQKYWADNLAPIERALQRLGWSAEEAVEQVDQYYSHPARNFVETDEALRLRSAGGASFITYKGPKIDPSSKTRKEIELRLPDGPDVLQRFAELLSSLGFSPAGETKKRRRSGLVDWQGARIEVSLDEVERLGNFVELELQANDEELQTALERVKSLAQLLGLTRNERRSYLEMRLDAEPQAN